jgi:hypothetical protein
MATGSNGNAPATPAWLGATDGLEPALPVGWPAVTARDGLVKVVGREYRFGGGPFLTGVTAEGASLLARPVEAFLSWPGGEARLSGPPARVEKRSDASIVLRAKGNAGPFTVEGKSTVEFDGMIRTDFTLGAPAGTVVREFALRIPIRGKHAKYLYHYPGQWGSVANAGSLPAQGWRHAFKPLIWLGDEERGLCWFAETDQNWTPTDDPEAIRIVRGGDVVTLELHVIASSRTLDRPLAFTFGFQATPVKAPTQDVWDFRICHDGNYGIESAPYGEAAAGASPAGSMTVLDHLAQLGVRTIVFHEHWTEIQNYTSTTHGEELRRLVKACHDRGIRLLLYFGYEMSNTAAEYPAYSEECLVQPRAGGYTRKPEQTAHIVCYRSHWQDFMAQGIARVMDEYGIDGVYLDGTANPWACANARHGCGYDTPDGGRRPTYPIFAVRQLMRRIYNIVKSRKPDGLVNVHQSTNMTIPTLAFATCYWDGEQISGIARGAEVLQTLPLDSFRTEFMGHQWGVPAELLCYGQPYTYQQATAIALLHDVLVRGQGWENLELESKLWRVMDDFGRRQADWRPYWANQDVVQATPPEVRVSLYNRGRRGALVVVSNLGSSEAHASVRLSREALGLPAKAGAEDGLTGRRVSWDGARLRLPVGPLSFRLIHIAGIEGR